MSAMRPVVTWYARILLAAIALAPLLAIAYVRNFQYADLSFENHFFHMVAIGISVLAGGVVTVVAWRCYVYSREPFLRWLTLGLLAFTLIYALHGILTPYADWNMWLFLLYGPASRLAMGACLLVAMLVYDRPAETAKGSARLSYWFSWIGLFLAIDALVAVLALSPIGGSLAVRLPMELSAMFLMLGSLALLVARRIRSPLMIAHAVSLAWFAESSIAFIISVPWSHLWWLAHVIFTSGFLLLSYAVAQAYLTTRSFSTIYSYADLIDQVNAERARAESALGRLQQAHEELSRVAALDPLTGLANRREFMDRAKQELARKERTSESLSILLVDLDHFKDVNDRYGHQAGDAALKMFAERSQVALRPSDTIGRIGGEEFAVLLPGIDLEGARRVGERIRREVQDRPLEVQDQRVPLTVSIGSAEVGTDGATLDECLKIADQRLYQAKQRGRNRVE